MSPEFLADWDADALRVLGKPLDACTIGELHRLQAALDAECTRAVADLDRAKACIADAERCGCTEVLTPQRADGSRDFGRAAVAHTCGEPAAPSP